MNVMPASAPQVYPFWPMRRRWMTATGRNGPWTGAFVICLSLASVVDAFFSPWILIVFGDFRSPQELNIRNRIDICIDSDNVFPCFSHKVHQPAQNCGISILSFVTGQGSTTHFFLVLYHSWWSNLIFGCLNPNFVGWIVASLFLVLQHFGPWNHQPWKKLVLLEIPSLCWLMWPDNFPTSHAWLPRPRDNMDIWVYVWSPQPFWQRLLHTMCTVHI